MDMATINRLKMKVGRFTAQLIQECAAAEPAVPGSTMAAQDVKAIVEKAFSLVEPDSFGVALHRIAERHGRSMPNKTAEAILKTICEILDEARV